MKIEKGSLTEILGDLIKADQQKAAAEASEVLDSKVQEQNRLDMANKWFEKEVAPLLDEKVLEVQKDPVVISIKHVCAECIKLLPNVPSFEMENGGVAHYNEMYMFNIPNDPDKSCFIVNTNWDEKYFFGGEKSIQWIFRHLIAFNKMSSNNISPADLAVNNLTFNIDATLKKSWYHGIICISYKPNKEISLSMGGQSAESFETNTEGVTQMIQRLATGIKEGKHAIYMPPPSPSEWDFPGGTS